MMSDPIGKLFSVIDSPTKDEMEQIHTAVENHKRIQTHGEYDLPGIEIELVMKDSNGNTRGGVLASTMFKVMHLEVLWVAEEDRRQGYGSELVHGAEQIGFENSCKTSQTWTFSFQGPDFYPTIGYQLLGIYDGYPNGITEHVFMKRLSHQMENTRELEVPDSRGLFLTTNIREDDRKILHEGLHRHVTAYVGDAYQGTTIQLIMKNQTGDLIGGLHAWTTLNNLIFEYIWIEADYQGRGLGRMLMLEMEKIARANGCIASQAYCFSFQATGFFKKMGYQILGISDGYPHPVRELYLIKKYA